MPGLGTMVISLKPQSQRGQNLVEFALLSPLVFLFILLLVDFGLAIDRREVLQHAVREGARAAAVGASAAEAQQVTSDQSESLLAPAAVTVCFVDIDNDNMADVGENIRVAGTYTYKFEAISGGLLRVFGVPVPSIDMDPSANMRLEQAVGAVPKCP